MPALFSSRRRQAAKCCKFSLCILFSMTASTKIKDCFYFNQSMKNNLFHRRGPAAANGYSGCLEEQLAAIDGQFDMAGKFLARIEGELYVGKGGPF